MFRRPVARLRELASPFLKRGARTQTSRAEHAFRSKPLPQPFWSSSKVLLFTGLTGTTAFVAGVNDEAHSFQHLWRRSNRPRYAAKTELENVCLGEASLALFSLT
jgi:D-lactate dehydrogenase (cytochrome)